MAEDEAHSRCESCTPLETSAQGRVLQTVTLVHGTYARDASWTKVGHPLVTKLQDINGTRLYRFHWSARNLHTERLKAGADLHDHLLALVGEHKEAEHHVVAHSHGGNVALYALRDEDARLDERLAGVHVTTLATPFLSMRWRRLPQLLFWLLLAGPLVLIGALPMMSITPQWMIAPVTSLGLVAVAVLAILVYSLFLHRRGGSTTVGVLDLMSESRSRDIVEREACRLNPPDLKSGQLFAILAHGDEAGLLLGSAGWISRLWAKVLARLSHRAVARGVGNFLGILIIVGFVGYVAWVAIGVLNEETILRCAERGICEGWWLQLWAINSFEATNGFVVVAGAGLVALIIGVPTLSLLLGSLLVTANLPFGRDMLFWNLRADIKARAAPDVGPDLRLAYQRGFRLAHSVYEDAAAVDEVVNRVAHRPAEVLKGTPEPATGSRPDDKFEWRRTSIRSPAGAISAVATTAIGSRAISSGSILVGDRPALNVVVWDLDSGTVVSSLTAEPLRSSRQPIIFALTPDGERLVAAGIASDKAFSNRRNLTVWDLRSGALTRTLKRVRWRAWIQLQHSKLSDLLASRPPHRGLEGRFFTANAIMVTPDGRHVISGNEDKTLQVWDIETGSTVAILKGHSSPVTRLAVTSDSRHCISWGWREVIVWDVPSRKKVAGVDSDGDPWSADQHGRRAITSARQLWQDSGDSPLPGLQLDANTPSADLTDRLTAALTASDGWWQPSGSIDGMAWGFDTFVAVTGTNLISLEPVRR